MDNFVTIFEMSPRDGLQNEKKFISTNDKVKFIDKLSLCGFKKIETSSFFSGMFGTNASYKNGPLLGHTPPTGLATSYEGRHFGKRMRTGVRDHCC